MRKISTLLTSVALLSVASLSFASTLQGSSFAGVGVQFVNKYYTSTKAPVGHPAVTKAFTLTDSNGQVLTPTNYATDMGGITLAGNQDQLKITAPGFNASQPIKMSSFMIPEGDTHTTVYVTVHPATTDGAAACNSDVSKATGNTNSICVTGSDYDYSVAISSY